VPALVSGSPGHGADGPGVRARVGSQGARSTVPDGPAPGPPGHQSSSGGRPPATAGPGPAGRGG